MLRTFKLSSFRYASFTAYKIALLGHASQQCYNILELASQQFRDVQEGNSCFLKYASCKLANFYDMQVLLLEIGKIALLQFLFGKLVMFKITSSFFSFEKCHFCFLCKVQASKMPNQQEIMFYMRQANNLASVTFASSLQMCKKINKFLHFLDISSQQLSVMFKIAISSLL